MADVEYLVGTDVDDALDGGTGLNDYSGGLGNDSIDGTDGLNTIHFNIGDGMDAVAFALPRTYQYADFLEAAEQGLIDLSNFSGDQYSNTYFANADRDLTEALPPEIASVLEGLHASGGSPGSVSPAEAQTALSSLIDWINTPTANVIEFGSGITLSDLSVQTGSVTSFGGPAEFSIVVKGQEGLLFQLGGTDHVAGDASTLPSLDIVFRFADGTSVSADTLLASPDVGLMGTQFGTDGDDFLHGSLSSDELYGMGGDDKINASAGFDTVYGGSGNDAIAGGAGGDYLFGEAGNDVLAAGRDGGIVSGGAGNDVYAFNRGDGFLSIDNAGEVNAGEIDTISFGKDIDPAFLVASVDPSSGSLTLRIAGTDDQINIQWFDPSNGMAVRPDQVISRAQFIDAQGNVRVFDLAAIVDNAFPDPAAANPYATVQLFDSGAAAHELTGTVAPAGGDHAVAYALTGDMFAAINHAPTATPGAIAASANEDAAFSYTLSANIFSDVDAGDSLSYSATMDDGTALPSWLQFDAALRTFSGTPANGDVGALSIKVTATDTSNASASKNVNLNVTNTNDPPSVAHAVADQTTTEDVAFNFVLPVNVFADADLNDSMTISARMGNGGALPSWLTFNPTTGVFSGTPANGDVGTLGIRLTARDAAGASVTDFFTLTIANTNDAPTATSSAVSASATEDAAFNYTLPANTFSDVDVGDTLSYSATMADGTALPSWLQFNAASRTFSGTPANGDVGLLGVKVTATDTSNASVSKTIDISVANTNDAPTATPGADAASATENAAFNYTLPANTFNDVDAGDSLSYSATMADGTPLPSWLHFDAATATFTGTPVSEGVSALSALSVKVIATDTSNASVSKTIDIGVGYTNHAPTASPGAAAASATEDAAFNYTLPANTFSDVDAGDSLSYSATMADGTALPSWLQFDVASHIFSGTPANGDVGALSVKVTATDTSNASVSKSIDISVANTNDAPTTTPDANAASATEDAAFNYTLPANTFGDVDAGDSLSYSATMADGTALPSWLQFDAASHTFSGTPANGDVGALSVKVTATDTSNASVSKSIDISVANTNDAPTTTPDANAASATEDAAFNYTLPANTFSDVDAGDSLSYSATMADGMALPSWLQFDAASHTFSGTPANGDVSALSVKVTATDTSNASVSKTIDISVANTNDAPTATPGPIAASATEDAAFTYTLPANTFSDVDVGDSLRYSATMADGTALPSWLEFDAASHTFSGTPANGDVGALSVKVTATDTSNASVSKDIAINVANTNDAPSVAQAVADQILEAGNPFSLVVPSNTFQDVDINDELAITARLANGDPLPSWLSFDATTRTLQGTPGSQGAWDIQLTATDLSGASVFDVFSLTVNGGQSGQILNGGKGDDHLVGGSGNDIITGGKGKDELIGGAGDDTLNFSEDGRWGKAIRKNVGSPGHSGSGDSVNLSGKRRSYDVFDGGAGNDTLVGTSGSDAILLDDSSSPALADGPRIKDVERINAGGGNDVVDLTSKRYTYGDVTIDGGSGNDVLWSSAGNDVLLGGSGNDRLDGGAGDDYLDGGRGNDTLNGGKGVDLLQGGSGNDKLSDKSGNTLMDGGKGNDTLSNGSGNALMIGGKGNDRLVLGGGYDVIAFNKGDGRDVVISKGGDATLSIGGGIRYQDLTLRRFGSDLILDTGDSDRITFEKWYDGKRYQAVSKLQVVAEAMSGFDENGADTSCDDKIETFDFKGLAQAFDAEQCHNPGLSKWTLTNALAQFHLGGSNTAALGGDLAYQYGLNGTLAGIAVNAAQETTRSSQLGTQAQTLQSPSEDGAVKLS